MKRLARLSAVAGLALAGALFAHENAGRIAGLLLASIPGLMLAGVFHVVPMFANAFAWQRLFALPGRPGVRVLAHAVWIRESVNGVLPVARVGGEIAAYRFLRRHAASRAEAAASVAADMALSVVSQSAFACVGIGLLLAVANTSAIREQLLAAAAAMLIVGAAFVLVQRTGTLAAMTGVVDRAFGGRLARVMHRSKRLDAALRIVYARRADVVACLGWQFAGWILGAGEIWLALYFLGEPRGAGDAIVIEAVIQAISSAAFVVPGALGIQEGAFVLIGVALGLDTSTSLALAAARRLRDLVIFVPGLFAWHHAESRSIVRRRLAQ